MSSKGNFGILKVIGGSICGRQGITWASFSNHLGIIFSSAGCHSIVIWVFLDGHLVTILGSSEAHFGVIWASFCGHRGFISGCGGIILGPSGAHLGITGVILKSSCVISGDFWSCSNKGLHKLPLGQIDPPDLNINFQWSKIFNVIQKTKQNNHNQFQDFPAKRPYLI